MLCQCSPHPLLKLSQLNLLSLHQLLGLEQDELALHHINLLLKLVRLNDLYLQLLFSLKQLVCSTFLLLQFLLKPGQLHIYLSLLNQRILVQLHIDCFLGRIVILNLNGTNGLQMLRQVANQRLRLPKLLLPLRVPGQQRRHNLLVLLQQGIIQAPILRYLYLQVVAQVLQGVSLPSLLRQLRVKRITGSPQGLDQLVQA